MQTSIMWKICRLVAESSNLTGILLLFPLRIMGSHIQEVGRKKEVVNNLDQIHRKGFVVSGRIKVDLEDLGVYEEETHKIRETAT
jgi:hypothetical protein